MKDTLLDISKIESDLLDLIPKAGNITLKYWLKKISMKKKNLIDIVTEADLESDNFIKRNLNTKYPFIPILSEESAPSDYSSYLNLDYLWVIDPLDGTTNFSRGDSNFCISIALVSHGKPIIGAIYKPIEKKLYWARKNGQGAFLNGNKLAISRVKKTSEAVICTDWSHNLETKKKTISLLDKLIGRVRQIKLLGSATANLALVAEGKIDLYWHVFLYPWDMAAAALIITESGGEVTNLHGGEWNPFISDILAGNPDIHCSIKKLIK
jgi:myo-inositol-1(or 4)-monophosphatase